MTKKEVLDYINERFNQIIEKMTKKEDTKKQS